MPAVWAAAASAVALSSRNPAQGAAPPTFQLDCVHASLLQHPDGRPDSLSGGQLIAAKGEVPYEEGPRGSPGDGLAVCEHVIKGDGQRGVMAVHHHAHRVADQEDVDVCQVNLCMAAAAAAARPHSAVVAVLVVLAVVVLVDGGWVGGGCSTCHTGGLGNVLRCLSLVARPAQLLTSLGSSLLELLVWWPMAGNAPPAA